MNKLATTSANPDKYQTTYATRASGAARDTPRNNISAIRDSRVRISRIGYCTLCVNTRENSTVRSENTTENCITTRLKLFAKSVRCTCPVRRDVRICSRTAQCRSERSHSIAYDLRVCHGIYTYLYIYIYARTVYTYTYRTAYLSDIGQWGLPSRIVQQCITRALTVPIMIGNEAIKRRRCPGLD